MDRAAFDIYVETQLAPTLGPGDVVILDNLKVHDSAEAKTALAERGAWFLSDNVRFLSHNLIAAGGFESG